ncbi:MAG TPA: GNAT family N-acetyltransferase [Actinoplanes sp.]|nr:GNAT family N-acetyltransferase [Actinoplanes sp.]
MDTISIRPYRGPDDDAVRALRAAEPAVPVIQPGDPWALVAQSGGAVAGVSWVDWWTEQDGTRLYLLRGCVHPARRRQGVGRRLLAAQVAQALLQRSLRMLADRASPGPPSRPSRRTAAGRSSCTSRPVTG